MGFSFVRGIAKCREWKYLVHQRSLLSWLASDCKSCKFKLHLILELSIEAIEMRNVGNFMDLK